MKTSVILAIVAQVHSAAVPTDRNLREIDHKAAAALPDWNSSHHYVGNEKFEDGHKSLQCASPNSLYQSEFHYGPLFLWGGKTCAHVFARTETSAHAA